MEGGVTVTSFFRLFIIYGNYSDITYNIDETNTQNWYVDLLQNGSMSYVEYTEVDNCSYFKYQATNAKWIKCSNDILIYYPPEKWYEEYYA